MKYEIINKIVREFYPIDENTQRLINAASYDLYFGPYSEGENLDGNGWIYPGFNKALDLITQELPDIGDLWLNAGCGYAQDKEPEGYEDEETKDYIEPFWEDWHKLDRKDVLSILLGKELANYI